ncbi:hypothetical protein AGABI2DRAFT_193661 [Agaricus bisporus var. bisporus H97]|uniref:hypothetical protein n=1 Tax=Agaricus bisporus var. bisporus (strain H97 / ATCC MYA-4626 / FGSC 10389) TaxID=936046 RepID=UPI00029F6E44|nr:hypothetical protein AGABI2DRAFT_193661 [Agaricus bisporus var. bisporus H97]EKV45714.1 hypothetical protein AGABI2DRAFT_193661 [Agaricus bisporus var. bisporus H97]
MKYGQNFPDVREVYIPRWEMLMAGWIERLGSSKRLAIETALALTNYGAILMRIADIQTQSVLEGAQSALRAYVEKYPIDVATEVADGFKNLRIDIQDFSDDFAKYVGNFCSSNNAVSLEASIEAIKQCQETISDLDKKIQESAMALGCSSIFGILSDYPVGSIGHYVAQRNEAQANLGKIKFSISCSVSLDRLIALIAVQTDFEKFKPDITDICDKLSSFASIWAFATLQSIELNVALDEGMVALTRKKFQFKLALLIIQIEPLREGLRAYAAQI